MSTPMREMTAGNGAETARREEDFQLIANTAPVMIWITGVDKLCTYVNQGWLDFTGRTLEAELGNGWTDGVHPDDLRQCLDAYTNAFDQRQSFQMEYRFRRHDGKYRWVLDSGVPRFDADGAFIGYTGSVVDVTQHRMIEDALSAVSQRLITAQEEERASIARELHDDIGQRLSLLLMTLSHLRVEPSLTKVRDGIQKAIQQASDLGQDMRALSHRLHSSTLDYIGLEAAVAAYCTERSEQHKVEIKLYSEDVPTDLPRVISLCIFRVLQEAMQNAIKHSGSKHFTVVLRAGASEVELAVYDTGVGFDPEQAVKGCGIGLNSMKERLKLVNGTVSINSRSGCGTTIHARVPLR